MILNHKKYHATFKVTRGMRMIINWIITQVMRFAKSSLLSTSRKGIYQEDCRKLKKQFESDGNLKQNL